MPPFGTWNLKLWYPDYQQRRALYAATLILEAGPTGRLYKERVGCPRPIGPAGGPLRFAVPESMGVTLLVFTGDAQRGTLQFVADRQRFLCEYEDGVLTGRFGPERPPLGGGNSDLVNRVSGWLSSAFEPTSQHSITFDITVERRVSPTATGAIVEGYPPVGSREFPLEDSSSIVELMAFLRFGEVSSLPVGTMKVYARNLTRAGYSDDRTYSRSGPEGRNYQVGGQPGNRSYQEVEYALSGVSWGGIPGVAGVSFVRRGGAVNPRGLRLDYTWEETYIGRIRNVTNELDINGRWIEGTYRRRYIPNRRDLPSIPDQEGKWWGSRADVLGFGISPRNLGEIRAWQNLTRRRLQRLMMAGNPPPTNEPGRQPHLCQTGFGDPVTTDRNLESFWRGIDRGRAWSERDDLYVRPDNYSLSEFQADFQVADPTAGGSFAGRRVHGYLAVPSSPTPEGGYPVVVALNGHTGSAYACFRGVSFRSNQPTDVSSRDPGPRMACTWESIIRPSPLNWNSIPIYWYGDGFARQGFVVLAIDVTHRSDSPFAERWEPDGSGGVIRASEPNIVDDYNQYLLPPNTGDGVPNGCILRPSIKWREEINSSWVEDGEKAWDVLRTVDLLLTNQFRGPGGTDLRLQLNCITLAGLSMGGTTALYAGALDDHRFSAIIPAGTGADAGGLFMNGHGCVFWTHMDFREYIDPSDLLALMAPRFVVLETPALDNAWVSPDPFRIDGITCPFYGQDRSVIRRARLAWRGSPERLVHYLFQAQHRFRIGGELHTEDFPVNSPGEAPVVATSPGLTEPTNPPEPPPPGWETVDISTLRRPLGDRNLFQLLRTVGCGQVLRGGAVIPTSFPPFIFRFEEIILKPPSLDPLKDPKELYENAFMRDPDGKRYMETHRVGNVTASAEAIGESFIDPEDRKPITCYNTPAPDRGSQGACSCEVGEGEGSDCAMSVK